MVRIGRIKKEKERMLKQAAAGLAGIIFIFSSTICYAENAEEYFDRGNICGFCPEAESLKEILENIPGRPYNGLSCS